jgi:pyrroloquinoline quinone biosynthesis protein B
MRYVLFFLFLLPIVGYAQPLQLEVLGVAQDGGYPHAGCKKECCAILLDQPEAKKMVTCLGIRNLSTQKAWMFEATPDFKFQLAALEKGGYSLDGIFLTHAHIGHYTGLMHLGREVMGARQIPVYAMPAMSSFLKNNGPWSQLVELGNIALQPLQQEKTVKIEGGPEVTPILVPHRDEYSETVGYRVSGSNKSILFIPDIDKWEKWEQSLEEWLQKVDYAFLDATFFENKEVPGRDMSEIPHPFVVETMEKLKDLPIEERAKVFFIHFNHTNPVLKEGSAARQLIRKNGFNYAEEGMLISL